jgi:hypothetical protein
MRKLQKFIRDTEGTSGRPRSYLSTNPLPTETKSGWCIVILIIVLLALLLAVILI